MGIFRDDDFTYVATVLGTELVRACVANVTFPSFARLATEGDLFHWVEQATCSPGRERESSLSRVIGF